VAAVRRCGVRRSFVPDEVAPSETTNGRRTIGCWNVRLLTHVKYPANISANSRWHTVRINSPSLLVPPGEGDAREPVASPHPGAVPESHMLRALRTMPGIRCTSRFGRGLPSDVCGPSVSFRASVVHSSPRHAAASGLSTSAFKMIISI